LKVTNNGPSTASNVTVSDPVPAQTSFVSATPSQGSCSSAVSCSLGTLAPGGRATITIVVHVDSTASGSLSNTATVSSDQPDGDSANNSATEKTAVAQNADLLITKSDSPDPVTAGGTLTYTLSVSNAGPSTAAGPITVTDTLPAGVIFQSASGTGWICSGTNTSVTCTQPTNLPPGAAPPITITVTASEAGAITNTATVSSSTADSNQANNTATATTTVIKASPKMTTSATATQTAGGTIQDTATLSGGTSPTGTISFSLYGPNDLTCGGMATSAGSATVSGNGSYSSSAVTENVAGTYRWIASYSGDANNNRFTTQCNDAGETSTVNKASPAISTTASQGVLAGGQISDTAHLAAGTNPTGTITFRL